MAVAVGLAPRWGLWAAACLALGLVVQVDAVEVYASAELFVENGTKARLPCTFKSSEVVSSVASVSWSFVPDSGGTPLTLLYYAGGQPHPARDVHFKDRVFWAGDLNKNDASLYVENINFQDNGTYTCDVRNPPDIDGWPGSTQLRVVAKASTSSLPQASDTEEPPEPAVRGEENGMEHLSTSPRVVMEDTSLSDTPHTFIRSPPADTASGGMREGNATAEQEFAIIHEAQTEHMRGIEGGFTKMSGQVQDVMAGVDVVGEALGRTSPEGKDEGVPVSGILMEVRDLMVQLVQGQDRLVQGQDRLVQGQDRLVQAVNRLVVELMRSRQDQGVDMASPRGDLG